jgi:hypothetical protein
MISVLLSRFRRPATRNRTRRLKPEPLEMRRVLAGSIDFCVPLAKADLHEVPSQEWNAAAAGAELGKNASGHVVKPFRINGGGLAPAGLPLDPNLPPGPHNATGIARGLGRYTGEGEFTLGTLEISKTTGAVTGTFQGTFVFTAANGDKLAVTYGDGFSGQLTGQVSENGEAVVDVEFDAFFAPDPDNSSGRFAQVVGGGWQMLAKSDSVSLQGVGDYTAPFDYTWSGSGTLEFAKKSK